MGAWRGVGAPAAPWQLTAPPTHVSTTKQSASEGVTGAQPSWKAAPGAQQADSEANTP